MLSDTSGADLVVLPELWPSGYFAFDRYAELAEPLDGDTVTAGCGWARRLGCFLYLGSFVERIEGRLHNTAVLVGPAGRVRHTYRKVHVFGYRSREAQLLTPGTGVTVADTALGPTSATTCYDLRLPELWRALVEAGAHTVMVPAAWPAERRAHWRLFTTTRAVEQQVLLVACNAVGPKMARCWAAPAGLSIRGGRCSPKPTTAGASPGVRPTRAWCPGSVRNSRCLPTVVGRCRPCTVQATNSEGVDVIRSVGSVALTVRGTGERLELHPEKLIVAGYTAKDEVAVAEHIAELAAIGVAPPVSVPAFYDLDPALLSTGPVVEVAGASTSGEVEPVLVCHGGRYFLGVGSDHADREIEPVGVAESKAACPKSLGASVVDVGPDLAAIDWDRITAECMADGAVYQQGHIGTLRHPSDVIARMSSTLGEVEGDLVLFCGTLPLLAGEFVYGKQWRLEIALPGGAQLIHAYETTQQGVRDEQA